MKKIIFLIAGLFLCLETVFAQISLNPSHDFYSSVQNWQTKGLITSVPPLRPYAVNDIKKILFTVIEKGNEYDSELAKSYLEEVTGKPWNLSLKTEAKDSLENNQNSFLLNIEPKVYGNFSFFKDIFSIGYNAGWSLRNKDDISSFYPLYSDYDSDARFDPATIGKLSMFLDINDIFSFSKNGFIIQAGINRSGYGDFMNNEVALNDSAFHRPSLSFSYLNKYFSYTEQLSMLGATLNSAVSINPKDNKYLAFHAVELKPWKWFSGSFYETSVFGKRFDFSYVLPVPFMAAQSFSGYGDSLMMGVKLKITPVKNCAIITDMLVDDLAVNDLVKLNFNSKNRIAWNTGVEYVPDFKILEKIGLNFLFVTPYTYSHWDVDDNVTGEMSSTTLNYQNYTNCGYTIGSSVAPNSAQLRLSVDLRPQTKLKINVFGAVTVHANIVETLSVTEKMQYLLSDADVFSTDGSINTHPWGCKQWNSKTESWDDYNEYLYTAYTYMNFLDQAHKLIDYQAGINASWDILATKYGSLKLKAGYCFEFTHNKGVDSNIFPGGQVTINYVTDENGKVTSEIDSYTYSAGTTKDFTEIVNYYENLWISNLKDVMNNIFTVGIEYIY